MTKLIAFFVGVFIIGIAFSGMSSNGSGVSATKLNGALNATDNVINVTSTKGFLSADFIIIGKERCLYANKTNTQFTGVTRGYGDTDNITHNTGVMVYSEPSNIINVAINANIYAVSSNAGAFSVFVIPVKFFTDVVPNLITFNFSFLGDEMSPMKYMFMACGIGLLISLALSLAYVATGVIKAIR